MAREIIVQKYFRPSLGKMVNKEGYTRKVGDLAESKPKYEKPESYKFKPGDLVVFKKTSDERYKGRVFVVKYAKNNYPDETSYQLRNIENTGDMAETPKESELDKYVQRTEKPKRTITEQQRIRKKLLAMKGQSKLKDYVIDYALDAIKEYDDPKGWFTDLQNGGCVSGMIGSLIYYSDTNKFYKKYEDDIENLITSEMEEQGTETRQDFIKSLNGSDRVSDITTERNLLAWYAFEETAYKIYSELYEQ